MALFKPSRNSLSGSISVILFSAFSASLSSTEAIAGKLARLLSNNAHSTCMSTPRFGITFREPAISFFSNSLLSLSCPFENATRAFVCANNAESEGVRAFFSSSGSSSSASSHSSSSKYAAASELAGLNRSGSSSIAYLKMGNRKLGTLLLSADHPKAILIPFI